MKAGAPTIALSATQAVALHRLQRERSILVTRIPDRIERGLLGEIEPGRGVYRALEKLGLCYETEEDPLFEGSDDRWTPSVDITDAGLAVRIDGG
jgi:hypothetical protein